MLYVAVTESIIIIIDCTPCFMMNMGDIYVASNNTSFVVTYCGDEEAVAIINSKIYINHYVASLND